MAQVNSQPLGVSGTGLSLAATPAEAIVQVDGQPAALAQLQPLAALLRAAGARLALTQDSLTERSAQPGFAEGSWLRMHSELTPLATPEQGGAGEFSHYPVLGLRGILPGKNSRLRLSILGVSPDMSPETLRAAVAFAAPGISSPVVGVCSSLSADVMPGDLPAIAGEDDPRVESVDLGLCAAQLIHGECPLDLDVLVVPASEAPQLARQATAAAGTRGLQVKAVVSEAGTRVSVLPYSWVNQPHMDPSGAILAAVTLLRTTGQRNVAERLHNAWLATLEAGVHTAALKHIAPYTRQVSCEAFFDAVEASLGARPERLTPVRYGHQPQKDRGTPPTLQLVR